MRGKSRLLDSSSASSRQSRASVPVSHSRTMERLEEQDTVMVGSRKGKVGTSVSFFFDVVDEDAHEEAGNSGASSTVGTRIESNSCNGDHVGDDETVILNGPGGGGGDGGSVAGVGGGSDVGCVGGRRVCNAAETKLFPAFDQANQPTQMTLIPPTFLSLSLKDMQAFTSVSTSSGSTSGAGECVEMRIDLTECPSNDTGVRDVDASGGVGVCARCVALEATELSVAYHQQQKHWDIEVGEWRQHPVYGRIRCTRYMAKTHLRWVRRSRRCWR